MAKQTINNGDSGASARSKLNSNFTELYATQAADVAALAAITPSAGAGAWLLGQYDFGLFVFSSADLSAEVALDTDKGIYVAPSSDTSGASGAWVRRVTDWTYDLDWWLRGDDTLVQDTINRALKVIPSYTEIIPPNRHMTIQRAASGSVNAGSSSFFGGIVGGIYIDKPGQKLIGRGGTDFDCEGRAMNAIMVRASDCSVKYLRAGNCSGQLETSESAGVCFQPSNFVHSNSGTGNGADISNLIVHDCDFYDCDSGVTGSPEREFKSSEPPYYLYFPSKLDVSLCRITGCTRQGVELFYCNDSSVSFCRFEGADKGVYTYSRFVRVIGSRNVHVVDTIYAEGYSDVSTGYIGVEVSTAGWYGEPVTYEMSADVTIARNRLHGFGRHVQIEDAQGVVAIHNNNWTNDHSTNGSQGINVNSQGIRNPAGDDESETNKNYVENLVVRDNVATGQSVFCNIPGTIWKGVIAGNHFTSNEATSVNLVNIDLPSTHPLERIHHLVIEDNTGHLNPAPTTAPIAIAGLKSGDQIFVDRNKLTPTAGGLITHTGDGTVSQEDNYSNIALSGSLWTDKFDPPRGPIFGEPNV